MTVTDADRRVAKGLAEQARKEADAARSSSPPAAGLRRSARSAPPAESIAIVPTAFPAAVQPAINERKHVAFLRLAQPRMTNLLHYFRANILVLAAEERYDYTPAEAEALVGAVEQMGPEIRAAFQQRGKRRLRGEFRF